MNAATLQRSTFAINRTLEFFTQKELQMQIGFPPILWPMALTKELIDNALDACESVDRAPEVVVTVDAAGVVGVQDNGPGLPVQTLTRSLDYLVRVSDKAHYISPTRGQLGNALKCVWAAPFVLDGEHSEAEVITGNRTHRIDVRLDRIAQAPVIEHSEHPDGAVPVGTLVKTRWGDLSGYLTGNAKGSFYNGVTVFDGATLVRQYAAFNPHASFIYADLDRQLQMPATNPAWQKWRTADPTSPHWYSIDTLRSLIAAYVGAEREGDEAKTVRAFVAEFKGLSASAKQKQVTDAAGMGGAYLHDLVVGDDIDPEAVQRLLVAMQTASRPVQPAQLGIIGEDHLKAWMQEHNRIDPGSIRYKRIAGDAYGLPFVLEVVFGVKRQEYEEEGWSFVAGLNHSPVLQSPFDRLPHLLGECRIHRSHPVGVLVHLACPRLQFTDRGKSRLALPGQIEDALDEAVRIVTASWKKAMRQADRQDRLQAAALQRQRRRDRAQKWTVKDAAYEVMEEAYKHAAGSVGIANARQIMYAARPLIIQLTGDPDPWTRSSRFTQHLLPDFIEEYPELTASWGVVYDARGKLIEPHTEHRVDIGGLAVRRYLNAWTEGTDLGRNVDMPYKVRTHGPGDRYQFALFIEKEGFNEMLDQAGIAERYDLAIMSTKGMSVTAARQLVESLSAQGVTTLVLHDFDKSGFSICHTLAHDTRRYKFASRPAVMDLGLRLADVQAMNLQSETVTYKSKVDPRKDLRNTGATVEEAAFLVRGGRPGQWYGERVELNAMTGDQFIRWLEDALVRSGVQKIVPDEDVVVAAFRRAVYLAKLQHRIEELKQEIETAADAVYVPDDLRQIVTETIDRNPMSWDEAIWKEASWRVAAWSDMDL